MSVDIYVRTEFFLACSTHTFFRDAYILGQVAQRVLQWEAYDKMHHGSLKRLGLRWQEDFLKNAKRNLEWVQNSLIQFIPYQNDRAKRGEMSVSPIPNYFVFTSANANSNQDDFLDPYICF
jgi:hypothetical protein